MVPDQYPLETRDVAMVALATRNGKRVADVAGTQGIAFGTRPAGKTTILSYPGSVVAKGKDASSCGEAIRSYAGGMDVSSRDMVRRGGDVDLAGPAELIGHPARAAMLLAVLDGRALPMSMLADEAGVAPSTASAHLSRLVDGGLLSVRQQGRHRYYELADERVAQVMEALAGLARPKPIRSLRADTRAHALRAARTCYDHIAGHLGVTIMAELLRRKALTGGDGRHHADSADRLSAPGHEVDYRLTETGRELFEELGVVVTPGRRRLVGYCVDWTEQRHHLAGAAGAALLDRVVALGWVRRGAKRTLKITEAGRAGFERYFGLSATQ